MLLWNKTFWSYLAGVFLVGRLGFLPLLLDQLLRIISRFPENLGSVCIIVTTLLVFVFVLLEKLCSILY